MRLPALVLRNLKRRPLATALTTISVSLGVGLFSAVGALRDASEQAFHRSAGVCDLLVGAKGSALELTLNALYHVGASAGNIPYPVYQDLRQTKGVKWSVPMVVGDSYRGFRVIGVTDDLFQKLEVPDFGKLRFAEGGGFSFSAAQLDNFHAEVVEHAAALAEDEHDHDHEADDGHDHHDHDLADLAAENGWFVAVIGSKVASETGLKLNSTFEPAHNLVEGGGDAHDEAESKVVGVLESTGTPLDRAIFIPAAAFYAIEGHQATEQSSFGGALDPHGLSAIMVRTQAGYYHLQVRSKIKNRLDAQAVEPVQEIRKLFQIVGNIDGALRMIALMVVIVALTGVLVAIYNTMGARQKEFAVLRALGAKRRTILGLVTAESAAISLFGGVLGMVVAGVGVTLASDQIQEITGVAISPLPDLQDLQFLLAITAMGALAGLVPAARAYRTEAARHLSSSL
ncbi:MAG: ABC transporter permease [Planctomycetes bacterium]|nr:ABC transporter permease [Planctomycetota bacterium]